MTSGTKYSIWLESRHKVIVSWINRASSLNPKSSDFGCAWLGGNIPTQSPEKLVTASGQTSSIHRELAYKYPSPSLSLKSLQALFFFLCSDPSTFLSEHLGDDQQRISFLSSYTALPNRIFYFTNDLLVF